MPVYFARIGTDGPVKIGHSANVLRRMEQLSVPLWQDLTLLRCVEGGRAEELLMHGRFAKSRLRGEWFRYTPNMHGDLGLADIDPADLGRVYEMPPAGGSGAHARERAAALRQHLLDHGLTVSEFAERCGVVPSKVENWIIYGSMPTWDLRRKIASVAPSLADLYDRKEQFVRCLGPGKVIHPQAVRLPIASAAA